MKKIITLISIFTALTSVVWAQATPNAGFENWATVSNFPCDYDMPDDWDNSNPQTALTCTFAVEKTTDNNSGSSAVKLITKNLLGNDVPGVVTTGTLPSNANDPITGGVAYTLNPDSIVGWYKCAPQGADFGFAEFTLFGSAANNADTIAEARFSLPNATVATYTRFSAPLVYKSANAVANSMWLLGSSNNDGNLEVGSNALFDDLELIFNPVVADVSIAQTVGTTTICAGESVTFTATPTNGGTTPAYQWQIDGVNAGTNSATFTTTGLTDGQVVTCILTSNLPGVIGSPVTSNGITMTVNATPATPTASSNTPLCEGASINLTTPTVTGATYSWTGPSSYTSTTQNPTLASATTAMAGTYNIDVTVNGCTSVAGTTTVVVDANVTPAVVITITSGGNPTCIGQSMTYNAIPAGGGLTPVYQWMLNGGNVGSNSATYTNGSIADGDIITCMLTSNATCATTSTATSNAITMSVTATVTPAVGISTATNPACIGQSVSFTAAPTNGGSTPSYQWQVDGSNVGTDTSIYTSSSLADGQVVTCIMTSSSGCASPSTATSTAVTMTVTSTVTPAVAIALSLGTNPMCGGDSLGFTASPTSGGTTPSYQWQVDGSNVGTDTIFYSSGSLTDTQVVTCVMTSSSGCASPTTATSSGITISVTTVSTPTISENGTILTSSAASGNQWYLDGTLITGATDQNYVATQNGAYTVIVTVSGCSSSESAATNMTVNGIGESSGGYVFSIYPNPSAGNVNIAFNTNSNSTYKLEFRNVLGQLVYQEVISDVQGQFLKQLDVRPFGSGTYVVSLIDIENETRVNKVFVQK